MADHVSEASEVSGRRDCQEPQGTGRDSVPPCALPDTQPPPQPQPLADDSLVPNAQLSLPPRYTSVCRSAQALPTRAQVWNATTLEPVFKYSLKTVSKDAWPALSWSNDDSAFAVAVPNAAHVFNASDSFASKRSEPPSTSLPTRPAPQTLQRRACLTVQGYPSKTA